MAANTTPIFPVSLNIAWTGSMTAANTDTSMTTGTSYLLFTAGSNGSKMESVYVTYLGNLAGATDLRFFVNNGATTATGANNALVYEVSVPILTTVSNAAQNPPIIWQANLYLKPSYRVYCTLGVAAANGIEAVAQGGDY